MLDLEWTEIIGHLLRRMGGEKEEEETQPQGVSAKGMRDTRLRLTLPELPTIIGRKTAASHCLPYCNNGDRQASNWA